MVGHPEVEAISASCLLSLLPICEIMKAKVNILVHQHVLFALPLSGLAIRRIIHF